MSRFATIVADPPWRVTAGRSIGRYECSDGRQLFGVTGNAARKLSYPSMCVDDIASMPVDSIAAPDAHLYLWTVNRYLREAFDVMRAWGFRYSTTLVWAKRPMGGGLGGCYGLATEYVLFGRRGKLPALSRVGRNWFDWKRPYDERGKPRHSAKPSGFMEMVESVSPAPRIELFARDKRPGWAAWGDEIEPGVTLQSVSQAPGGDGDA